MMRLIVAAFACFALAACTTTNTRLADPQASKPPAGARVLTMKPDVSLGVLTASGMTETRDDWSSQARDHISAGIEEALTGKAHSFKTLDQDDAMQGRTGQLFRLNETVGTSIMLFSTLPTKKGSFDWSLGEGAQVLGSAYESDYALFVSARGSYASGGRVVAFIAVAAIGGSIPMGQQQAYASLVDLKTGRIVWYNTALVGTGTDIRQPDGAKSVVKSLLKDIPL